MRYKLSIGGYELEEGDSFTVEGVFAADKTTIEIIRLLPDEELMEIKMYVNAEDDADITAVPVNLFGDGKIIECHEPGNPNSLFKKNMKGLKS